MTTDHGRPLPPTTWDHLSIQQIRDMLNPELSTEDLYRIVDRCDEWIANAGQRLADHRRDWDEQAGGGAGEASDPAALHGARTRADLSSVVEDIGVVRTSLETVTAKFTDVRNKIEDQYLAFQSTREPMLGWALANDDEDGERTRREATLRSRELMAQYEQTANDELAKWSFAPAGTRPGRRERGDAHPTADDSVEASYMDGPTVPLADGPTAPIRSQDGQSATNTPGAYGTPGTYGAPGTYGTPGAYGPSGIAGAAPFPGGGSAFGGDEFEHNNPFVHHSDLFPEDHIGPPVIGGDTD